MKALQTKVLSQDAVPAGPLVRVYIYTWYIVTHGEVVAGIMLLTPSPKLTSQGQFAVQLCQAAVSSCHSNLAHKVST